MNKKKDLKAVFEFIADFLREDEDTSPAKGLVNRVTGEINLPVPEPVGEEPKKDSKVEHALAIMKRIDDMDKAKANAHNMIKFNDDLKSSLQRQLNELRHEHAMKVSEDTIAEEEALNPQIPSAPIVTSTVEEAQEKHEEIKTEIKQVLGLDMDKIILPGKYRPKPKLNRGKGKNK